jgi:DNA-binding FrmR family transcriptional regulator
VWGYENMQKSVKKKVLNRMNYLIGHLKGVKKMIENDEYCVDIILQNEAVISAIKKVNEMVLENHLNTCVAETIKSKNEKERRKKMKELLDLFKNK